jgi:hypothetical protein
MLEKIISFIYLFICRRPIRNVDHDTDKRIHKREEPQTTNKKAQVSRYKNKNSKRNTRRNQGRGPKRQFDFIFVKFCFFFVALILFLKCNTILINSINY